MKFREEVIGDCRLILGDCREILPTLGKVDAVVTDPPYGITAWNDRGDPKSYRRKFGAEEWTRFDQKPETEFIRLLISTGKQAIIFGCNHFDNMPATKQILVWDKTLRGMHFNDAELAAAYGCREAVRIFPCQSTHFKEHPAQKPLEVMRWVLGFTVGDVLDPFMGSGTTGVACVKLGRKFIGIEIEPKYFDIACRRISEAEAESGDIFEKPKPLVGDFLGGKERRA